MAATSWPTEQAAGRAEADQPVSWVSWSIVLALLLVVVLAPAASLAAAAWVDHLESAVHFALAGLVIGLMTARTRLPAVLGHLLGGIIGAEFVTIYFAGLLPAPSWEGQVRDLGQRVGAWLDAAFSGGASSDTLMFALVMAALAYVLGYFSAWSVVRARTAWPAIVPNGAALLLNLSYASPSLMVYCYAFLAASLLLLVAVDRVRREELWRSARIPQPAGAYGALFFNSAAVAALVIALAWLLPTGSLSADVARVWSEVSAPWQSVESHFDRLFASIQPSERAGRSLAFGRTLAPRGAFELGQQPVLAISAPQARYWRARTFDRYTGQVMVGSETAATRVEADAALPAPKEQFEARYLLEQRVRVLASQATLVFAADQPLKVSVPAFYEYRERAEDFDALRLAVPIRRGQEYTVVSAVSGATAEQLRQAGSEYPAEVRERYLQLPRRLPPRVAQLARQLTAGASTPYDAALAIEAYLRDLTYSTSIAPPPPDRDWVDYILFETREGYCDYFATAMAVLLRSLGIPARVATGFAPGEYDEASGLYIVRESHAHSWTEVYFPRYGWITFEPSAIRPVPNRIQAQEALPLPSEVDFSDANLGLDPFEDLEALRALAGGAPRSAPESDPLRRALMTALTVLGGLLAVVVAALLVGTIAWRRGLGGLAWYQRFYAQLARLAAWCGLRPRPTETPYEFVATVSAEVPPAGPFARAIADAYVEGTYGPRPPDRTVQGRVAAAWRAIRLAVPRELLGRRLARLAATVAARLDRRAAR